MAYQAVFKRYEMKFMLDPDQKKAVDIAVAENMVPDEYGQSSIYNIYFDTENYLLARRSIEKPMYKEKLRLRSYGVPYGDNEVFVEIKKKFDSVVYKRRVSMGYDQAMGWLCTDARRDSTQIESEIQFFKDDYRPVPKVELRYERLSFKGDDGFRLTFDTQVRARNYGGSSWTPLLEDDITLMELKTPYAIPLWMVDVLSRNGIRKSSFSKYGKAYELMDNRYTTEGMKEGALA